MPRRAATNKGCALLPRTEMPPEILPCTREPDLERHRTLRKSCKIRTLTQERERRLRSGIDGKIKATVSLRAVGGRKCLSAHCFGWHCSGTVQNAPVPLQGKRRLESIS